MGQSYTNAIGEVPDPKTMAFRDWYFKLLGRRLSYCPIERRTSYYFSQSGSDSTGIGTEAAPWKSLSKAQTTISGATGGGIALYFKRGDEWNESTGLTLSQVNLTVASYGSTGAKPLFSRFDKKYTSGWSLASGNRYTRSEATTIGNVRYTGELLSKSVAAGFVLSRQTSSANCEATGYSWFWGANVLHVNLGGGNPNSVALEGCTSNNAAGVTISADGCRVDGIRADGWGCDPANPHTPQAYQFESFLSGTDEGVFSNCEGYYGGTHIIGHYVGSGTGGIVTYLNCSAGFTTQGGSGETIYNTYSSLGGQETIFHGCTVVAGTHPNGTTAWAPRGSGFYAHTAGVQKAGLILVWDATYQESVYAPGRFANFTDIPIANTLDQVRTFVVGEKGAGLILTYLPAQDVAWINCRYTLTPADLSGQAFYASGSAYPAFNGWVINTIFDFDETNQAGAGSRTIYNANAVFNTPKFWHCAILVRNGDNVFRIDFDATSSVPSSNDGEVKNCILGKYSTMSSTYNVGIGNRTANQNGGGMSGNAYFGVTGAAVTTPDGYSFATSKVELSSLPDPVWDGLGPSSPFANAGVPIGVEYDIDWRSRKSMLNPTIGPWSANRSS